MAELITQRNYRFDLPEGKKKERIDVFLVHSMENATRNRIQKLIEAGYVTINGKTAKSNTIIKAGDTIHVTIPVSPRPDKTEPENIPLDIVYEDDYLLIINKPPGMVAHPSLGHFTGTLVNALLYYTKDLSPNNGDVFRPGIVHRIDKDTSGLLVIAKEEHAHSHLAAQFSRHSIEREYWTVVWGRMKSEEGIIEGNIARSKKDRKKFTVSENEGKPAVTMYKVLEEFEFASLLSVRLKTGRTHQIRVHFSYNGHPVFGDETYGGRAIMAGSQLPKIRARVENLLEIMPRQALHARTLGFIHPATKEQIRFESKLPPDFEELLSRLRV